ncbi:MAG: DUF460 domain-containing protein, partial [Halobacteria archaeon]|nr:DUF460 domain-containing protein [Halobacteria archaeon]
KNGGLSDVADEILFENEIPVGSAEGIAIREVDELAITRESSVREVIEDWEERAEERRRERNEEMVDNLISEYRVERQKQEQD